VGIDVPQALVVLAEPGREHEPEQNSFTLAIWSESVIPWAIWEESSCTYGLISGKSRSISWSTPRLCVL